MPRWALRAGGEAAPRLCPLSSQPLPRDSPKAPGGTPDTGLRVPPWPAQDLPLAPGRGSKRAGEGTAEHPLGMKAPCGLSVGRKEGGTTQPPAEMTSGGHTAPTTHSPGPSAHQAPHPPASPCPSAPTAPLEPRGRAQPPRVLIRYQHMLPKPGPAPGHPAPPSQPPPAPARLLLALVISEIPPCRRRSEAGRRVPRERQAER